MSERKHRATGKKPPGGKRPGAGRPKGSDNALEYGQVQALRTLNYRVPETLPAEAAAFANDALIRIVDVMHERVPYLQAGHVLKAATRVREEFCGPLAQKVEHSGADGTPLTINVVSYSEDEE